MIEFRLPWPPSCNRAWRRVGDRTLLSREQRQYRETVKAELAEWRLCDDREPLADMALPLTERLAVALHFHAPTRGGYDLDNRPKALLDAMTHAGLWTDDGLIDCLMLYRAEPAPGDAGVTVRIWRYDPVDGPQKTLLAEGSCAAERESSADQYQLNES